MTNITQLPTSTSDKNNHTILGLQVSDPGNLLNDTIKLERREKCLKSIYNCLIKNGYSSINQHEGRNSAGKKRIVEHYWSKIISIVTSSSSS